MSASQFTMANSTWILNYFKKTSMLPQVLRYKQFNPQWTWELIKIVAGFATFVFPMFAAK